MKIGLQTASYTWPGGDIEIASRLKNIAQTADTAGFFSLWVMDHFFQIRGVGSMEEPMLESYSTLSYLAALTKNVRLGTMVTGVIYRHPGILVKTATTLDVLSGGRAYFGIGAAWFEQEAKGLGVDFPPLARRFERLEETLKIALQMWSEQRSPFDGQHYHLADTLNHPQSISRPHPPILIGGSGEQKTLYLVAKYADACNLFAAAGTDTLRHKLEVLQRHCQELGRPYEEIEKTALSSIHLSAGKDTPAKMIDICYKLAGLGFQQVIFNMTNAFEITPLETIGREVIPVVSTFS